MNSLYCSEISVLLALLIIIFSSEFWYTNSTKVTKGP